jgi:DNA-binding PadR family transcriptional regulator
MARDVRLSGPTLRLLKVFVEKPLERHSGAEIARITNIGSGTLYPILQRLENAGWLKSEWESVEPSEAGRPRRRLYKLTGQGQNKATQALGELQTSPGVLAWNT